MELPSLTHCCYSAIRQQATPVLQQQCKDCKAALNKTKTNVSIHWCTLLKRESYNITDTGICEFTGENNLLLNVHLEVDNYCILLDTYVPSRQLQLLLKLKKRKYISCERHFEIACIFAIY